MFSKAFMAEVKWGALVLAIAFALVLTFNEILSDEAASIASPLTELNLFFELLVLVVFSAFVVFGIRGFYERYSQRFANVVIFVTGVILTVVIFVLSYQILFQP